MTDGEFTIYTRSLLNEATAAFWTDADLAAYKQVAIITVGSTFWNLLAPFYKTPATVSLAAGQNLLTLPTGWFKTIRVEVASTGRPLKPIANEELPEYVNAPSDEPVGYTFQDGKLRILPNMTAIKTDYLRHWYIIRPTTLAHLPDDLHPLVAVETVLAGRTKDENVSPALIRMRDRFEFVARKALSQFQTQAPMVIEDTYDMGD